MNNSHTRLLVIVGPTAAGKTDIALQLAGRLNAEIISADSRLFYQGMDIGTAKPGAADLQRIPHHLVNVANPDEIWSLTMFQQAAHQAIQDVQRRSRLPILVGGTGQYIHAIIYGWEPPEQAPDLPMRAALENLGHQLGASELHRRLELIDPQAAARIEPNNLRRTVRALEVIFHTGYKFSTQRQKNACPYSVLIIGVKRSRPELYQRIDMRIEQMVANGLIEETQHLLNQGYDPDLPCFSAIGYREITAYLQGKMTLDEAVMLMKRYTRQYVRRQSNWFKESDPNIHWFDPNATSISLIENFIQNYWAQ